MKKLSLNSDLVKLSLTRTQMRKVTGGYDNPNCGPTNPVTHYYCCTGKGTGTDLGTTDCQTASRSCSTMLTNDLTRCN